MNGIKKKKLYTKKIAEELIPGDIILHPIYRLDGMMLIKQYKVLTSDLIHKIKQHTTLELPIIVTTSKDLLEEFLSEKVFMDPRFIDQASEMVDEFNLTSSMFIDIDYFLVENKKFDSNSNAYRPENSNFYEENFINYLNNSPLFLHFERSFDSNKLQDRANGLRRKLLNFIEENHEFNIFLNRIINYKDVLLLHSINTTSICLMIGLTIEMTDEELIDLVISALVINISLTYMDKNDFEDHLKRTGGHEEFYKMHLQLLKQISEELPIIRKESIVYGVLDHYQWYNGNGYPKGKSGKNISLYGRIISIAHGYDEMVGGYFHNNGIKPLEAIKSIWKQKNIMYDPDIINIFIQRTNYFKIGQPYILLEYGKGKIIGFEDYLCSPHLPIVRFEDGQVVNFLNIE